MSQLLNWIGENEAVLSGIAAAIAIVAVILALSSRTLGLIRTKGTNGEAAGETTAQKIPQEIRYCRPENGPKIAWSSAGSGYPLIRSLGWFTNLEMEWDSPISSQFWQSLAKRFRIVRYDGRGMGLSDRDCTEFSPETKLADLEAVVEAAGVEKFALLGLSEGGTTAIAYAHKHPERVSHLIVWGSFLKTPDRDEIPQMVAVTKLIPKFWGSDSAAFHQMFTASFLPEGNAAQNKLFNDLQRTSATPETCAAFLRSINEIDIREIAPDTMVPTLVLHRKGDLAIPVRHGKEIAAKLPNAKLVLLEGSNHWMVGADFDMDHIVGLIDEFVLGKEKG
jgi:pimeloyl-ACP methyl ester carboxylesterase